MNKNKWMICAVVALMGCSSCSVMKSTSTSVAIQPIVIQEPTIAELTISPKKITQSVTWNFRPFGLDKLTLADRKSNLVARVVKTNGGDVFVEPQWEYAKVSFGERTLTLTGYVAKYTGFHRATPADIEALKVANAPAEGGPCDGPKRGLGVGAFGKKIAHFFGK